MKKTIEMIQEGIREGWRPGAQLWVERGGEVLCDGAWGEARPGVAMGSDSVLLWRSAVKPVVAVAVAQQVERGALGLDDSVAGMIPGFAQHGKEAITVRHVLTHTGGFRAGDVPARKGPWREALEGVCAVRPEPRWVPGERAGYHVLGSWLVLGELVRRCSGMELGDYLAEEVFAPLGMKSCYLGVPECEQERLGERLAWSFDTSGGGGAVADEAMNASRAVAACVPGGNGRGPARELGRFYRALLNGGALEGRRVLKEETVREWTTRRRVGMMDETFRHRMDWALGFMVNSNRYGAETVPYGFGRMAGEEAFGHGGAQSCAAFADPERDLVVVLLFNGMPGEPAHQRRAREVLTQLYKEVVSLGKR